MLLPPAWLSAHDHASAFQLMLFGPSHYQLPSFCLVLLTPVATAWLACPKELSAFGAKKSIPTIHSQRKHVGDGASPKSSLVKARRRSTLGHVNLGAVTCSQENPRKVAKPPPTRPGERGLQLLGWRVLDLRRLSPNLLWPFWFSSD